MFSKTSCTFSVTRRLGRDIEKTGVSVQSLFAEGNAASSGDTHKTRSALWAWYSYRSSKWRQKPLIRCSLGSLCLFHSTLEYACSFRCGRIHQCPITDTTGTPTSLHHTTNENESLLPTLKTIFELVGTRQRWVPAALNIPTKVADRIRQAVIYHSQGALELSYCT